jgi:hypothetical protein
MKKVMIREVLIYSALLILLGVLMHPDLLTHLGERFSLMQERSNFIHPFIYAFIVYIILFLFRYVTKKLALLLKKIQN